ncbi:ferredoxin-thioredoxin reductase catalytic chain, chloroplastic [Triticum dicoccoides]|uniref:ferredoxin-thioredoxin reductase catalytic chain, chloroplastic n=1 Tax=Triticum dicoccoides TaxID=85692 RepID=UPI0008438FFD|nr:ferredoxin-thioredoxin reductase catalytic chain, chloroplastic [Triticum dicoccoides]XP_044407133.1 ferredoxin-thioredoxin reductase catalytic chain, chloroplastic-like [Triticum aestivum]
MMSITSTAAAAAGSPVYTPLVSRGGRRSRCAVRAQAAGEGTAAADGAASEHKSLEIMRKFSEQYARRSSTFFCSDKSVTAVVIKGLADHKDQLGAPLCPCRHYDDKAAEAAQGFWNCPCVPMRERKECHCMLFLTPDNDFAGEDQAISLEEIKEATSKY